MNNPLFLLIKRIIAYLLSLFALLNGHPSQPAPGGPDAAAYVFSSAQEYQDYYLYCTDEDPEPYSWSQEALAARNNVEKVVSANGFTVALFRNNTARINALEDVSARDVVIPSEVEGHTVTAIYSILPYQNYDAAGKIAATLRSVVIPDSVEYIMERAFEDLSNLRSVSFGRRLKYMEANAFRDCSFLTTVALPDALEEIPAVAFNGCLALTEVVFGSHVRTIGRYAFEHCPCLRKVTLPASTETLEEYCFAQCDSLSYVYIPAGVTSIGYNAFGKCGRLTLHGENGSLAQQYAAENGIPFRVGA